ncbi:MFS transporter [Apibacter sp. HY039]|uniref:MFS transporter n=1 Tax=Apibacter sp. HY039 TaxID=2501476 RepID=UPI000FEBBB95|nr:MFS transporter [Apibacter sp. HY039]
MIISGVKKNLTNQDYRILGLSALGGALEFYDFIIYVFFAKQIEMLFFPPEIPGWLSQVQTYGIFAAGYLARPFGGIIMAHFGDRLGRKKMFAFSIFLMSAPTLLIGFLPPFHTAGILAPFLLLFMRICQGAAVGGEIPGAWVFVSEHVPTQKIGLACGILTGGLTLGILLGSLVSTLINTFYSASEVLSYGWRLAFILGGIFGLISMFLRRWLKETPIFSEMAKRKKLDKNVPVKTVISKHKHSVIVCMLLTWVLSAGIMVVILLAPSYLQSVYKFPVIISQEANSIAIAGVTLGCILSGLAADKIGFSKTLIAGSLFCIVSTYIFYTTLSSHPELLFLTYGLAGLGVGVVGCFAFYMVRSFPVEIRYSGVSFSFNIAYAFAGGLTPLLISLLTNFVSVLAPAYYVIVLFSIGLLLGIYLLRIEKK